MGLKELRRTKLGPFASEGARLLWVVLQERRTTLAELARELGTKAGVLNRWAWCDVRPAGEWAGVLEDRLGIPVRSWHQEPTAAIEPQYRLADTSAAA